MNGPLADALERDRQNGKLEAVARLWRGGYQPTLEELETLAATSLNPAYRVNPNVEREITRKANAKRRYRELRKVKIPVEGALRQAAAESGLHVEVLRYVVAGKDCRVEEALKNSEDANSDF